MPGITSTRRVYLDANVFIAFVKADMGKPFKLMYQDVDDFLRACQRQLLVIVLSELVFHEIARHGYYSREEVIEFFQAKAIRIELISAEVCPSSLATEYRKKGVPAADALHAALAVVAGCDALVTFNKKDFWPVSAQIQVLEPKELIE